MTVGDRKKSSQNTMPRLLLSLEDLSSGTIALNGLLYAFFSFVQNHFSDSILLS